MTFWDCLKHTIYYAKEGKRDVSVPFSSSERDPRHHSISTVYIAKGKGVLKAKDDVLEIGIFTELNLPDEIAFDHHSILSDYFKRVYYYIFFSTRG
jgi:ADP-ribose pyrophosphatase YjhB (NUDIX family)